MAECLVDTNVVSYLLKGDSRADLYRRHLDGRILHLSFVTVAELYRWAVLHNWGAARIATLSDKLSHYGILQPDDPTLWQWARVMSTRGHPVAPGDAWIAAAAIRNALPLVTHNRKHFEGIPGLVLISEA